MKGNINEKMDNYEREKMEGNRKKRKKCLTIIGEFCSLFSLLASPKALEQFPLGFWWAYYDGTQLKRLLPFIPSFSWHQFFDLTKHFPIHISANR